MNIQQHSKSSYLTLSIYRKILILFIHSWDLKIESWNFSAAQSNSVSSVSPSYHGLITFKAGVFMSGCLCSSLNPGSDGFLFLLTLSVISFCRKKGKTLSAFSMWNPAGYNLLFFFLSVLHFHLSFCLSLSHKLFLSVSLSYRTCVFFSWKEDCVHPSPSMQLEEWMNI